MKNWYCLTIIPRQEKRAMQHLQMQGIEYYIPFVIIDKRIDKSDSKTEPLFPGYGFVNLDDEIGNFTAIRSTRGVKDFVRFNNVITKVGNRVIDEIISRADDLTGLHGGEESFQKGDSVTIQGGIYDMWEGIYESKSGRERSVILLRYLENLVAIEMDDKNIVLKR